MRQFFVVDFENMCKKHKLAFMTNFDTIHIYSWSDGTHVIGMFADPDKIMQRCKELKELTADADLRFIAPSIQMVASDYDIKHQNQTIFQAFRKNYYQNRDLPFEVGKKYYRYDGKVVTILKNNDVPENKESTDYQIYLRDPFYPKDYECVMGDDVGSFYDPFNKELGEGNIWRYNRRGVNDIGRVCGSNHDMSDPHNLYFEEVEN